MVQVTGFMQYLRVSIQGIIAGGERWSINPVFAALDWIGADWPYEIFFARAQAVAEVPIPIALRNIMSNQAGITSIKLDAYDATEALLATATVPLEPQVGGNGAPTCPRTTAVVTSLRTNQPGPSGRGRLYWPTLGLPIDSVTVNIPQDVINNHLEAMRTYLSAIEDALNVDELPGLVYSLAVHSKTLNKNFKVVRLAVGNQPDTQRRRKDAIVEAYTSAPYVAP